MVRNNSNRYNLIKNLMMKTIPNSQKIIATFLLLFLFGLNHLSAQFSASLDSSDFVTTYQTSILEPYVSDSSFRILTDSNYHYNYDLDWNNDGIFDTLGLQGDFLLTYDSIGVYTIRIRGDFPRLLVSPKIIDVKQWGDNAWKNMEYGFRNTRFLQISAHDSPNLDSVTSLEGLFFYSEFDGRIDHWDVSNIQNMSKVFASAWRYNQPISNWDVSSVTDMSSMFSGAQAFNQPIANWDVSNVTDMDDLFSYSNFNQPLANWDVSSVKSMLRMFTGTPFNQPIGNWDVSSVENMNYMFNHCLSFNQELNNWDVSAVKSMFGMFRDASSFNKNISNWTTDSVINMGQMFYNSAFNTNIDTWNVSNVIYFGNMFNRSAFNQNINSWDVSSAVSLEGMFAFNSSFNHSLSNWDVSNVTSMREMFRDAFAFNQDLSAWNLDSIKGRVSLYRMFDNSAMSVSNYDATLNSWGSQNLADSITFGVQGLEYCASQMARNTLISKGWIFFGDNLQAGCSVVGLDESVEKEKELLKVYPTITDGSFKVEIEGKSGFDRLITIFDQQGRLILNKDVIGPVTDFNISNLTNGLYIVKYRTETRKVYLQK